MTQPMKRFLYICAVNVVVLVSMLIVIEGIAGYLWALYKGMPQQVAERRHTKYDAELGWVNEPNIEIPDMYGPRIGLRINGQGFRSDHDFVKAVPAGKIRVICSGDSFTLGYGVDDDHTWCQFLTSHDRRLETINMGQGGYGVDQAYLWYKRDGIAFEHHVQILAMITNDFSRMQSADFLGYGKPILVVEDGALVVKGVPVRRPDSRWLQRLSTSGSQLRTVTVLQGLLERLGLTRSEEASRLQRSRSADDMTRAVMVKILEDLKRQHDAQRRKLIILYLPKREEIGNETARPWREFIGAQTRLLGIPLVDAFDTFESVPARSLHGLFIAPGQMGYIYAQGHLSVKGNELVATLLQTELKKQLPNSAGS